MLCVIVGGGCGEGIMILGSFQQQQRGTRELQAIREQKEG